ncbi:MAG TPA: ankyrin repeat domain-containing protein [Puia sp.]|nr:ankyrin repeat domain-containing protein [Puia sp.]
MNTKKNSSEHQLIKGRHPHRDHHGNTDAFKQCIANRASLNEKEPMGGSSPLISASLFGRTEMAKALINAGADINFQNNDGSTALHTAAFFCRTDIVYLLLAAGANKTIRNKYGQTAYELVTAPFASVKPVYDALGKILAPIGLTLDYPYIEKTRPLVASILQQ